MTPKINLVGQRFGRLTVIEDAGRLHREVLWRCLCDCGKGMTTLGYNLKTGRTRSCGCSYRDRNFRHGHARKGQHHPLYGTWAGMIKRCTNENARAWKDYGGRGITVCAHWRYDFNQFLADMGEKPSRNLSIDKDTPGGNGNYHCDKCGGKVRWATRQEQNTNQRPRHKTIP